MGLGFDSATGRFKAMAVKKWDNDSIWAMWETSRRTANEVKPGKGEDRERAQITTLTTLARNEPI